MSTPGFAAEASVYKTRNHYQTANRAFLSNRSTSVTPQDCGFIKGILCYPYVRAFSFLCGGICDACVTTGGSTANCAGCIACMSGLGGFPGLPAGILAYKACHDCLSPIITTVIDSALSGGGGGGTPPPDCTTTGCRPGLVCCDCISPAPCTTHERCNQLCQL
jgi:hypothetical protein